MLRSSFTLLLLALVWACGGEQPATDTASKASAVPVDDTPQDGGTLVRRLESNIVTVNPVIATSRYDRLVDNYVFTPMVNFDENLEVIPGLAEKWEISKDGRDYTFHLNPKATFSDGKPVRAHDVLFTLRKVVDPATEAAQIAGGFENLDLSRTKILGDHTILVAFREGLAGQLTRFNDLNIVPEHVYSKGDFKNDYNDRAVGSGPYRVAKFESGREIVLERRDDYWGERPHLQTIVMKVVEDANTAWNALLRGDIDETVISAEVWKNNSTRPDLLRRIEFRRFYTLSYNYIAWNHRNPLFADARVRRALGMCLDIGGVIDGLYNGTARAMSGHFTPDDWAYNPSVPVLRYDVQEAKRILASVGWLDSNGDGLLDRNGKPFRFDLYVFAGSATAHPFAQLFQQGLKAAGVEMNIVPLEPAGMIQRVLAGNYAAAYMGWDLDPDPDPYNAFHSAQFPPRGQNFVFWSNPEADQLMLRGRSGTIDQGERTKLYQRLHEVMAAEQPYRWTVQVSVKWAINRRVKGVKEARGYGLFLWYPGEFGWWIPRDQRTRERTAK